MKCSVCGQGRHVVGVAPAEGNCQTFSNPGPDGYLTLAVDGQSYQRFGRHVEGANIHHHPTQV